MTGVGITDLRPQETSLGRSRKAVRPNQTKVICAAAQARFKNSSKSCALDKRPGLGIVDPAESQQRLVARDAQIIGEPALHQSRHKPPLFGPIGADSRLKA